MGSPLLGVELLDRLYGASQFVFGQSAQTVPCASLQAPEVPGASVLSISGVEVRNVSADPNPLYWPEHALSPLDICNVNITLTHPGENDTVSVEVWLPLDSKDWNGRFLATGGGGFSTGNLGGYGFDSAVPVSEGYSTAWTDGGHELNPSDASSWALDSENKVHQGLLFDFASRSIHDLAVVGKAMTEQYFGKKPSYSYLHGCSTVVDRAIWQHKGTQRTLTEFWPVALRSIGPTLSLQNIGLSSAIKECDPLDGLEDGVIDEPTQCTFDPLSLVGKTATCPNGADKTITSAATKVVKKIFEGPRDLDGNFLWHGLLPGTSFKGLALTIESPDSTVVGVPMSIGASWIQNFLKEDPKFDLSTLTYAQYAELFKQSVARYETVIGTGNPDLYAFRAAGGKLLSWHGLADDLIFAQGTIDYRRKVESAMGGSAAVNEFYRLFLVPGGAHCVPGNGVAPASSDAFKALVAWVEKGENPNTLDARWITDGVERRRRLCPYPLIARYDGAGDATSPDSFSCVNSTYA